MSEKKLFLAFNRVQATGVEREELFCLIFAAALGRRALEARGAASGFAVAGGHGDKFHKIQGNIFVPTRAERGSNDFGHESLLQIISKQINPRIRAPEHDNKALG